MSTQFKTVADFMPSNASRADVYITCHTPGVKAFEACLRAARCGSRDIAIKQHELAQEQIEKMAAILGAMVDCLRHHRGKLPRECCGGCTTATCVDGRAFTIPADAATLIDSEVS